MINKMKSIRFLQQDNDTLLYDSKTNPEQILLKLEVDLSEGGEDDPEEDAAAFVHGFVVDEGEAPRKKHKQAKK